MLSSSPAVLLRARSAVVGISPGANQHELLATLRSQGVSLFDARTQTSLRTWPCRAGVQLTGAAVLHPASGRMVGVRDHSVLFSWHRDGADRSALVRCAQSQRPAHAAARRRSRTAGAAQAAAARSV